MHLLTYWARRWGEGCLERLEIQEWEQKTNRFKNGIRDTGVEEKMGQKDTGMGQKGGGKGAGQKPQDNGRKCLRRET